MNQTGWQRQTEKPREGFKLMRPREVNKRTKENDTRLYYCDADIDFVVTTISKPHHEPYHRHTKNVESYYVFRGRLVMHVEGQRQVLAEGDMIVIYPGVCHSFETTDEEVCFYAIKKFAQLRDKEVCRPGSESVG